MARCRFDTPSVNGHRLIRYVGDPNPWLDPEIVRDIVDERIPPWAIERIREFDRYQKMSIGFGKGELVLGPSHGFIGTYQFGPYQFAQYMLDDDACLLLGNEWDRWQFIDCTDNPARMERERPLTKREWAALLASFAKLNRRRRLRPEFR